MPAVAVLPRRAGAEGRQFDDIVKVGRTHLQDAIPVTFGQEFSADMRRSSTGADTVRLESLAGLRELAIGGTAVGTGLNTPPGICRARGGNIAGLTGLPVPTIRTTSRR